MVSKQCVGEMAAAKQAKPREQRRNCLLQVLLSTLHSANTKRRKEKNTKRAIWLPLPVWGGLPWWAHEGFCQNGAGGKQYGSV